MAVGELVGMPRIYKAEAAEAGFLGLAASVLPGAGFRVNINWVSLGHLVSE